MNQTTNLLHLMTVSQSIQYIQVVHIDGIDDTTDDDSEWFIHLVTNKVNVKYKIDSGAQVSIILKHLFSKMSPRP